MKMSESIYHDSVVCRTHLTNSDTCVFFKAGKNRDGYFDASDLLQQVDNAINIFESKTNRFATALFLFDNAPSHQRRALDARSAQKMPKGSHPTWRHHKDGPKMRATTFRVDITPQNFYFVDNHPTMPRWFKGMEAIIRERGLWPQKGLNVQCEGFKCKAGKTDCCCRQLLFTHLISRTRSLTWKSSSPPRVTSVISIPNTTASSTSLSSTGELQSWSTGPAWRRRTWRKWKRMSRTHLTTFPLSKFDGELIVSTPIVNDLKLTPYQSCKSRGVVHQCIWSRFEQSGGSLGKPEISWSQNIASRNGYKAKKWAWAKVWHTGQ